MHSRNFVTAFLVLFLAGLWLYSRGLGSHGIEYRDDEIFYYRSAREMVADHNYLSPTYFGKERFQKPILFYWLVILSYHVFGITWFAARFVSVIFAALAVYLTWRIAGEFYPEPVAWLSALITATLPMFFRHAKNVVPDMALNFFIVWAVFNAIRFAQDPSKKSAKFLFFAACALGFLTKGFAAVLVPFSVLVIFAVHQKQGALLKQINFPAGISIMAAIILPWFLYMIFLHGNRYVDYMIVEETGRRLFNGGKLPVLWDLLKTFTANAIFYIRVILSSFAPWGLLTVVAIPWALKHRGSRQDQEQKGTRWLLIWIGVVFFFFSFMKFRIIHYMLVLSTPLAVLLAAFFYEAGRYRNGGIAVKWFAAVCVVIGSIAVMFFHVFLGGAASAWLLLYLGGAAAMVAVIFKSPQAFAAPAIVGIFMVAVVSQSERLIDTGVSPHGTLQRFANVILQEAATQPVIGVGSHDLHEKEFQVYFDQPLLKVAENDNVEDTRIALQKFFDRTQPLYCLIMADDYQADVPDPVRARLEKISRDYIFRRRMFLDEGFFAALLKLDRRAVRDYLMEEVILVRNRGTFE